jgi:hypothetical protein
MEMNLEKPVVSSDVDFWNASGELQLQLYPGESCSFTIRAAKACEVRWAISQIGEGSQKLAGGETRTIPLTIPPDAPPHALIRGEISILRGNEIVAGLIPVCGWVRKPQPGIPPVKPPGPVLPWIVGISLTLLGVAAVLYWIYVSRPPTLIISPAQLDLGTLYYSPPVGGSIDTSGVFTAKWQGTPTANLVLVAQESVHYTDQTGHEESVLPIVLTFPIGMDGGAVRIPLQCHDLTNEVLQVGATITLSASNSPIGVTPSQVNLAAVFKPTLGQ